MSQRREMPSLSKKMETNQNDNHNEMPLYENSSHYLECNNIELNGSVINPSSDRVDEKLELPSYNLQANNTSSGRTSSSQHLSERTGRPSFSLAGIFPISDESNISEVASQSIRDTPVNEYTPIGTSQPLIVAMEENVIAVDIPVSGRSPASNTSLTPDNPIIESVASTKSIERLNVEDNVTSELQNGPQSHMQQVSDSLKIIRDMLTSPRHLLSPRGYSSVNSASDYTAIDIRETKTEPPPASEANSNNNAAPSGFSIMSPRITMPKLPPIYDFGYTKSVESFVKESRFAQWSREELILLLIHKNIHIRKQDEITEEDLVEYCDNYFDGKKLPNKRGPFKPRDWRKLERAALNLQNRWIMKKLKRNKKMTKTQLDLVNEVYLLDNQEFDYTQEIYDPDDASLMKSRHNSVYLNRSGNGFIRPEANTNTESNVCAVDIESGLLSEAVAMIDRQDRQDSEVASLMMTASTHQRKNEKEKKRELASKLVRLLDAPWTPPDWASAERSTDFMNPRKGGKGGVYFETLTTTTGRHCSAGGCGEQCDLFREGKVSEFSIYGPGVTNYFKFIKWLTWVMFTVSLVSLPMLVINITGGTLNGSQGLSDLAKTTVGNLETAFSGSNSTNPAEIYLPFCDPVVWGDATCGMTSSRLGYLYMSIDILITSIVLVGFLWLLRFESREEKTLNKNTVYTSMFAVAVKNLPVGVSETEVKSHFELALDKNFHVHSVDFAYDNEQEIQKCKERGDLIKRKNHLVNLHRYQCTKLRQHATADERSLERAEEQIKKLRDKFYNDCKKIDTELREFESILEELEKKCDIPRIAYLIFNECVGAQVAFEMFRPSIVDWCFTNPFHQLEGKRLMVEHAPEPSTIIWENLNTPAPEKWSRRALSTFFASLLILISFSLALAARVIQTTYVNTSTSTASCPSDFSSWSQPTQQTYIEANPDALSCYCSQFSLVSQENDPYCKHYAQSAVSSQILIYFASAVVLIINTLIEYVMERFTKFEKHLSQDTKELSLFYRLFFLKYLNSSLVFLIGSNAHVLSTSTIKVTTEFDNAWYQSLGVVIILVQMGDIFLTHVYVAYLYHAHQASLRRAKRDPTVALTQSELNKLHVGPPMRISTRYSGLLSTFFLCMTFNTGIPLLNLLAFANFFLFYFVEKFLFINLYRAPHRFGAKLGDAATMLIPLAIIIHLAMSIWVLSNPAVFSAHGSDQWRAVAGAGTMVLGEGIVAYKIKLQQTFPLFLYFLGMIGGVVFFLLLDTLKMHYMELMKWFKGHHFDVERRQSIARKLGLGALVNGGFKRAVERNLVKDIASYSILKNPRYKEKFAISWNFAMTHRRVSEVRLSINFGSKSNKRNSVVRKSITTASGLNNSLTVTAYDEQEQAGARNDMRKSAHGARSLRSTASSVSTTTASSPSPTKSIDRRRVSVRMLEFPPDFISRSIKSFLNGDSELTADEDDVAKAENLRRTLVTQVMETEVDREIRLQQHSIMLKSRESKDSASRRPSLQSRSSQNSSPSQHQQSPRCVSSRQQQQQTPRSSSTPRGSARTRPVSPAEVDPRRVGGKPAVSAGSTISASASASASAMASSEFSQQYTAAKYTSSFQGSAKSSIESRKKFEETGMGQKRPSFTESVFCDPSFHPNEVPISLPLSNSNSPSRNPTAADASQGFTFGSISPPRRRQSYAAAATCTSGSMALAVSLMNKSPSPSRPSSICSASASASGIHAPLAATGGNLRFVDTASLSRTNSSSPTSAARRKSHIV